MTTTTKKKNIEKRPGYKHTPLGWLPEEWSCLPIVDIAHNNKGSIKIGPFGSQLKKEDFINSGYKVYDQETAFLSDFEKGSNYISKEKFEKLRSCSINPGDVIISMMGTIGAAAIVPKTAEVGILNSHLLRVKPDEHIITSEFLKISISDSPITKKQLLRKSHGGIMSGLSAAIVKSIDITVPPLPEQRKIAAILSTWDDAIQQTQALIKQLGKRNKGLAQQLLKPKKEWKEVKMSALFERITDKNEEGNDNVVTISAQRGFIKQETFFKKRVASDTLHNYFLVEKGDFCYNKSYSTGYDWGAIKRLKDFDKAVVTTLYICFRIKDETKTSGAFFEHFFEAGILDKGLSQIAHEGGRAHGLLNVTPKDFFNLKLSIPDRNEQQAIAVVLDKAAEELKQQEQYLTTLQQQKKGLMQQLLTGAVRVKIDKE